MSCIICYLSKLISSSSGFEQSRNFNPCTSSYYPFFSSRPIINRTITILRKPLFFFNMLLFLIWRSDWESNPVNPCESYGLANRCFTIQPPLHESFKRISQPCHTHQLMLIYSKAHKQTFGRSSVNRTRSISPCKGEAVPSGPRPISFISL